MTLFAVLKARLAANDDAGTRLVLDTLTGGLRFLDSLYYDIVRGAVQASAALHDAARAIALANALGEYSDRAWTLFYAAEAAADDRATAEPLLHAGAWALHAVEEDQPRNRLVARLAELRYRGGDAQTGAALLSELDEDMRYNAPSRSPSRDCTARNRRTPIRKSA